jgi:hypothetical protein
VCECANGEIGIVDPSVPATIVPFGSGCQANAKRSASVFGARIDDRMRKGTYGKISILKDFFVRISGRSTRSPDFGAPLGAVQ